MSKSKDKIVLSNMETMKHIQDVRANIYLMMEELDRRARCHDQSKLESPEKEIFGENYHKLKNTEYGSKEYAELLEVVKPAIDHHYSQNRHHPEFHKNGVDDMNLLDLIEMLCDWKSATKRNKNGNIRKSIEINGKRYNMSPQLIKIFENTIKEMFND